ncbi:MAG TPA: fumarylacetoacetate hydrolase family protein [Azospirillum sp.]
MTEDRAERAAALLIAARTGDRLRELPEDCRPRTAEEAYAIQDLVLARTGPANAWKVGAKTPEGEPACAPMPVPTVHPSPATLPSDAFGVRLIEAEIAYRFGRALPPRPQPYTADEVLAAVDAVLPGIEVVDGRFQDRNAVDALSILADNITSGAYVTGAPVFDWRRIEPARQGVQLRVNGAIVVDTVGGNPAGGDLTRLLVWAANALSMRGHGLKPGDIVTTGSCTGMTPAGPGDAVEAEFPGLGTVSLRFAAPM